MHGIVAYRRTFLRANVCEKFTSFCQALKKMHAKETASFFPPHGTEKPSFEVAPTTSATLSSCDLWTLTHDLNLWTRSEWITRCQYIDIKGHFVKQTRTHNGLITLLRPLQQSVTIGVISRTTGLQCFLLVGRQEEHPACKNWVMRCWCGNLCVCMWSSWCHYHPNTPLSLASFKSGQVLRFWYWYHVVLQKRPLNGCSSSSSSYFMNDWRPVNIKQITSVLMAWRFRLHSFL